MCDLALWLDSDRSIQNSCTFLWDVEADGGSKGSGGAPLQLTTPPPSRVTTKLRRPARMESSVRARPAWMSDVMVVGVVCVLHCIWPVDCRMQCSHRPSHTCTKHTNTQCQRGRPKNNQKKTTKNNPLFIQRESAAAFSDYLFLVKYKIDGKNMNYFGVSFAAQSLEFYSSVFIDIHL